MTPSKPRGGVLSGFRTRSLDRKTAQGLSSSLHSNQQAGPARPSGHPAAGGKLKRRASDLDAKRGVGGPHRKGQQSRRHSVMSNARQRPSIEMVPGTFRKVSGVQHKDSDSQLPVRLVEISLDGKPLGFRAERRLLDNGGNDAELTVDGEAIGLRPEWCVIVCDVDEQSAVHAQGLLSDGDQIMSINGTAVAGLDSQQQVDLLMHVSDCLRLAIKEIGHAKTSPVSKKLPSPVDVCGRAAARIEAQTSPDSSRHNSLSSLTRRLSTETASPVSSPKFRPVRSRSQPALGLSQVCDSAGESFGSDGELSPCRRECGAGGGLTAIRTAKPATENSAWRRTWSRYKKTQPVAPEEIFQPGTRMLEMAQVFLPEEDQPCLSPSERKTLLAECLAEEFDLPFLVEPTGHVAFSLRSLKTNLEE